MAPFRRLVRRFLVRLFLLALAAALGAFAVLAWKPAISPVDPPASNTFPNAIVVRGATLAALGDCIVCHTVSNGRSYAGGRSIPTPFGAVFSPNITPDTDTGIGRWSLDAFRRAMRDGVDRDGRHLYPVLPYPHFTRATDEDIAALYAFLMTRSPVAQAPPPNQLKFPFNLRILLAGWDLVFLNPGEWRPDPSKQPDWNRGAYLVDAIGHCGACHTPRNAAGAEQNTLAFSGGEAEGWHAPSLRARPWSVDALTTYLRTGLEKDHGVAAGPMAPVTHQLARVPDEDVHAIAVYIASLAPSVPLQAAPAEPRRPPSDRATDPAADPATLAMFDGACGACHAEIAPMTKDGAPPLSASAAAHAPTARNVAGVILHGILWREGRAGPYMPAFSGALTDAQVAALAGYVRARYTDLPPWRDIDSAVQAAKTGDGS